MNTFVNWFKKFVVYALADVFDFCLLILGVTVIIWYLVLAILCGDSLCIGYPVFAMAPQVLIVEFLFFAVSIYLRYTHIVTRYDMLKNTPYISSYGKVIRVVNGQVAVWGNAVWKGAGEIIAVVFPRACLRGYNQISLDFYATLFRNNKQFTLEFLISMNIRPSESGTLLYGFVPQELYRMFREHADPGHSHVLSIEDWIRGEFAKILKENTAYQTELANCGPFGPDFDLIQNLVRGVTFPWHPSNTEIHASLQNIKKEAFNTKTK